MQFIVTRDNWAAGGRWGAGLLLTLVALAGCEPLPGTPGAKAPPAPAETRAALVSCYSQEYQRTKGAAPTIDAKENDAANEILNRYNNNAERACGAVKTALAGPLCGMPPSLASVDMCQRRQSQAHNNAVDPNVKASLQNRIRENERREMQPTSIP